MRSCTNQIKSQQNKFKHWFLVRTRNRAENQQTLSTYDSGSGRRTRDTLVKAKPPPLRQTCTPTFDLWSKNTIPVWAVRKFGLRAMNKFDSAKLTQRVYRSLLVSLTLSFLRFWTSRWEVWNKLFELCIGLLAALARGYDHYSLSFASAILLLYI